MWCEKETNDESWYIPAVLLFVDDPPLSILYYKYFFQAVTSEFLENIWPNIIVISKLHLKQIIHNSSYHIYMKL